MVPSTCYFKAIAKLGAHLELWPEVGDGVKGSRSRLDQPTRHFHNRRNESVNRNRRCLKVVDRFRGAEKMRSFAAFDYAAGSWNRERRVVARLEASARGFDARYIVTSLGGDAGHLYEDIYCARGQAENLIKLHKGQLASDRTSCQSPIANQFRLVLHTAAYWLMLALRDAVPRRMPLAWAEFATLRQSLLKIGARVVEKAARIRIHFASACPDAALFRLLAGRLAASGP